MYLTCMKTKRLGVLVQIRGGAVAVDSGRGERAATGSSGARLCRLLCFQQPFTSIQ